MTHQKNLLKSPSAKQYTAAQAEYMELRGAVKDGDCEIVDVPGGISKERGCCDRFLPDSPSVTEFRCGKCKFED